MVNFILYLAKASESVIVKTETSLLHMPGSIWRRFVGFLGVGLVAFLVVFFRPGRPSLVGAELHHFERCLRTLCHPHIHASIAKPKNMRPAPPSTCLNVTLGSWSLPPVFNVATGIFRRERFVNAVY